MTAFYRVNLKEKKQQTNVKIVAKMFPQGSITAWKNSVFNSSYLFILNTYLCRLQYSICSCSKNSTIFLQGKKEVFWDQVYRYVL